jgi:hypothetical protein
MHRSIAESAHDANIHVSDVHRCAVASAAVAPYLSMMEKFR